MKVVLFIKNNYNDYINISSIDNFNLSSSQNKNYELLSKIRKSLSLQNLKLTQYKCILKKKDIYYYIIKLNTNLNDIELDGFINKKYHKKSKETKILTKYQKANKRTKIFATIEAFTNKFGLKDLLLFLMESVILFLSIFIKYKEQSSKGATYLLIGSLVIILFSSLEKITTSIFETIKFNKMCKSSTSFNIVNDINNKNSILSIKNEVIKNYKLSKNYNHFQHIDLNNNETFIYSDVENKKLNLNANNIKIKFEKNNYKLNSDSRSALAHIIGNKLNDDKTIFNGKLLGINSELIFDENKVIKIKDVRYHHYVSIDEMIYRNIFTPFDSNKLIKGNKISLNPLTNSLMDISNSHLTNLIGVNLLVELIVNNESYFIINNQSLYNDVNQERLVPTSSGSLDKKDKIDFNKLNKDDQNLKSLLFLGMLRELKEESYLYFKYENGKIRKSSNNLLDLEVVDFNLLGFGRLVSKSGKPDFFGHLVLKSNNVNIIEDILNNYKDHQNRFLGTKNYLETINMKIVSKNELFSQDSLEFSPQLQYSIFLLKNK